MKPSDVRQLVPGLYRLHFVKSLGGGTALAVIGEGDGKATRWYTCCHFRAYRRNLASLVSDEWERVEKAELLRSREGDDYIRSAQQMTFAQPVDPEIAATIRDLFLTGHDVDAIAVLSRELGMTQREVFKEMGDVVDAANEFVMRDDYRSQYITRLRTAVQKWRAWKWPGGNG